MPVQYETLTGKVDPIAERLIRSLVLAQNALEAKVAKIPPPPPAVVPLQATILKDETASSGTGSGITQLTGDVTAGPGSGSQAATLSATGVTPGSYGDASHVGQFTVDAKGRLTAAANVAIAGGGTVTTTGSPASGNLTQFSGATSITNGDLSGDVTTSGTLVTTVKASIKTRVLTWNLGDGSAVIPTGSQRPVRIPYAGTLKNWTIMADQSGSITLDVWKDTFANYPPTNADSITNGHEPALSSADHGEDTDITDWSTTSVTAGDVIIVNVDSATTLTWAVFQLVMEVD